MPGSQVLRNVALAAAALAVVLIASGMARTVLAEKPAEPPAVQSPSGKSEVATFAAGCFWCVQSDFAMVPGVLATTTGYTGGTLRNPTYDLVARGLSGHVEAVQIVFDPVAISYETLLEWYWRNVDPVDARGQFCDRGIAYRPVIFVHSPAQRRSAEESKAKLEKSGIVDGPIAVKIEDAKDFTTAEPEHQNYAKRNPWRYRFYRHGCGRDQRLRQIWNRARS